jgi:UTP-glucose-1-phosphate uridylyltransferase
MVERRRTRWDVEVGGSIDRTGHAFKSKVSNRMEFRLGYLWYSKVYQQLVNTRLTNGKDIILLDAMEYRVNVQGVRLYAVTAYDFKTKKEVKGYVGQSTLDNKTVFRKTAKEAINAAQNLTVRSVNEKLGVNNV